MDFSRLDFEFSHSGMKLFNKNFMIGALNCQGLKTKYEMPEFIEEVSGYDIFGVSEIWMEDLEKSNINIPGYKFYPVCRSKEKGPIKGGVGVFAQIRNVGLHMVAGIKMINN